MPDRIEAATYLMAAAGTYGDVTVNNVLPVHLSSLTHKLMEMGANVEMPTPNSLRMQAEQRLPSPEYRNPTLSRLPNRPASPLYEPVNHLATGSASSRKPFTRTASSKSASSSGWAPISPVERDVAVITGVEAERRRGQSPRTLRAGAAMVIAGAAEPRGRTDVYDLHHFDSGYELPGGKTAVPGRGYSTGAIERATVAKTC